MDVLRENENFVEDINEIHSSLFYPVFFTRIFCSSKNQTKKFIFFLILTVSYGNLCVQQPYTIEEILWWDVSRLILTYLLVTCFSATWALITKWNPTLVLGTLDLMVAKSWQIHFYSQFQVQFLYFVRTYGPNSICFCNESE